MDSFISGQVVEDLTNPSPWTTFLNLLFIQSSNAGKKPPFPPPTKLPSIPKQTVFIKIDVNLIICYFTICGNFSIPNTLRIHAFSVGINRTLVNTGEKKSLQTSWQCLISFIRTSPSIWTVWILFVSVLRLEFLSDILNIFSSLLLINNLHFSEIKIINNYSS